MRRCHNTCHCDNLVNLKGKFVRLDELYFCSNECALEYIDSSKGLHKHAVSPHEDWGDANPLPKVPPRAN